MIKRFIKLVMNRIALKIFAKGALGGSMIFGGYYMIIIGYKINKNKINKLK